ncbi:hypothetical protein K501DRAFT_316576 [Backusella circina FSU 941]|nr:hypothetical protein K501DRAFT_316576 [Backusella circina FSU 941]
MFKRLLILEAVENSLWIKIVGLFLIVVRFADWPYELAFHTVQRTIMNQTLAAGSNCLAQWGTGVIILNFVADCLANLFLSGMFVRRLYIHIKMSRNLMSHRNRVIEDIAKKSLICLILTFFVNFAMNLLKTTYFIGDRSDAFTAYFEIIESTLLVEALRVDYTRLPEQSFCEHCGMVIHHMSNSNGNSNKRQMDEELNNINILSMSPNNLDQSTASYNLNHSRASHSSPIYSNDQLVSSLRVPTN